MRQTILQQAPQKNKVLTVRGLRWWMIGLLTVGTILNFLTRSTLAVAAPTLLEDLQITEQQYSWIVGAFQIAIMFQPVVGYVLDVLGLRNPDGSAGASASGGRFRTSSLRLSTRRTRLVLAD